jgi:hypothetical protein
MTKIRRILPGLCLGAVFVVLLIFNLKVFAACPQTQAWQVWCPNAVGPLCSQCKKAFCNCNGIQQWQDWFQCTNNPNKATKCVNQLNNQNQPLLQPCYQTCTCMPAQGGGCTINQNNCQPPVRNWPCHSGPSIWLSDTRFHGAEKMISSAHVSHSRV